MQTTSPKHYILHNNSLLYETWKNHTKKPAKLLSQLQCSSFLFYVSRLQVLITQNNIKRHPKIIWSEILVEMSFAELSKYWLWLQPWFSGARPSQIVLEFWTHVRISIVLLGNWNSTGNSTVVNPLTQNVPKWSDRL